MVMTLQRELAVAEDANLVQRAQAGESAAFAELYERYFRRLVGFCYRRIHDEHEAQDIAHDAYFRAWKAIDRLRDERVFFPWLCHIAANLCADAGRRRQRVEPIASEELPNADDEPPRSRLTPATIESAIAKLDDRYQRVLRMRAAGDSYSAIAHSEGISESAVKSAIWRARQALSEEVRRTEHDRPSHAHPTTQRRRRRGEASHHGRLETPPHPIVIDSPRLWQLDGGGFATLRNIVLVIRHHRRTTPQQLVRIRFSDLEPVAAAFGLSVGETVSELIRCAVIVAPEHLPQALAPVRR